jgi:GalNAc-alpha-(1->4)-GalNAc-alpha-(1->3)-diNAcBac-PP-undecaprenol alpha-1,4-N-acetyl-D-galactosaminyltransferase
MIVGIVLPYLKSRGTEKQALRLAEGFIKRNTNVVLFVVQGWGESIMYDSFKSIGVSVVNVGRPIGVGKKNISPYRLFSLVRLLRVYQCTSIISRAGLTNRIAGFAGRIVSTPVTTVLSGSIKKNSSSRKYNRLLTSVYKFISLGFPSNIVSVSKEGCSNFKYNYPLLSPKTFYIQNGVELPEVCIDNYSGKYYKDFSFCFAGSIEIKRKGLDILLKALSSVVFNYKISNVVLILIGVGRDEDRLKQLAEKLHVSDQVRFIGEQACPIREMSKCDGFVLSSRREGLPNALLEAMSLGMACISTDCDTGPREVIINEKNGLLVDLSDHEPLAIAMVRIIEDAKLRVKLGNEARKTIKDSFSHEKMIDGYFSMMSG